MPSEPELIVLAKSYFEKYGLLTVLISATIEGLILVGFYYPGSLVIFLGVIFAGRNIIDLLQVVSVVSLGLFTSYLINFYLGKYGWYKLLLVFGLKEPLEKAKASLNKYGLSSILLSYWQPNIAALVATAAGILHFSVPKFFLYSFVAVISWNTFWGGLVYFLGEKSLNLVGPKFIFIVVIAWIAYQFLTNKIKPEVS